MVWMRVLIVVLSVAMFVACSGQQPAPAQEAQGDAAEQGVEATQDQVHQEDFEGGATTATVDSTAAEADTEQGAAGHEVDE